MRMLTSFASWNNASAASRCMIGSIGSLSSRSPFVAGAADEPEIGAGGGWLLVTLFVLVVALLFAFVFAAGAGSLFVGSEIFSAAAIMLSICSSRVLVTGSAFASASLLVNAKSGCSFDA